MRDSAQPNQRSRADGSRVELNGKVITPRLNLSHHHIDLVAQANPLAAAYAKNW